MTGMLGSITLEVAIGLAFLYLLLAIFCTTLNEWIAGVLKTRAGTLHRGIQQLFNGQSLVGGSAFLSDFYKHPLMISMMQDRQHPSYISATTFSNVMMDLLTPDQQGSITFPQLEAGIKALPDGACTKDSTRTDPEHRRRPHQSPAGHRRLVRRCDGEGLGTVQAKDPGLDDCHCARPDSRQQRGHDPRRAHIVDDSRSQQRRGRASQGGGRHQPPDWKRRLVGPAAQSARPDDRVELGPDNRRFSTVGRAVSDGC